jgi:(2R)-ethylmalonyl-CoA mutase
MSQQPSPAPQQRRDQPWLFRTYAGHSSAAASNELYRTNLAKGQTGLSVAFDLPTQTGYDGDHPLAAGEVGKVGVPIGHLGDMERLFEGIPLERMNTSMTINATAPWLLALYVAAAERQGVDRAKLQGTVQNDIIKEYLSRGTYIFPPGPSLRLIADVVSFTYRELPRWNPPTSAATTSRRRGHARPGAGLRARHGGGGPRRGARLGPGAARRPAQGGRAGQLLRQRRPALRHRDLQDAGLR